MAVAQDLLNAITSDNSVAKGFLIRYTECSYGVYMLNARANKTIVEVDEETLKYAISQNLVKFYNIELKDGKVVGTNGSIGRYASLINGSYLDSNLVIIAELVDGKGVGIGYKCCTPLGQLLDLSKEDVIKQSKLLISTYSKVVKGYAPISNGKLLKKDGKTIVSSIKGEYNKITVKSNDDKKTSTASSKSANNSKQDIVDLFKAIKLSTQREQDRNKNPRVDSDDLFMWLKEDKESLQVLLEAVKNAKTLEEKSKLIGRRGTDIAFSVNGDIVSLTKNYRSWRARRTDKYIVPKLSEFLN